MIIAVHEELQARLNTTFPITKVFQYSTVSSLARYLSQKQAGLLTNKSTIEHSDKRGSKMRNKK